MVARTNYAVLTASICLLVTLYFFFTHYGDSVVPQNYFNWRSQCQQTEARPTLKQSPSRLELTLQGNEERYQEAVVNRHKLMEDLGGPGIPAFPEKGTTYHQLWDFFVPAFSCPFPVYRVGTLGDGGKWVCGFERALNKSDCVVYSMGVEQQSSFEETVLERFDQCQVYGFDFSVRNWGPQLLKKPALLDRAHFFPYRIGGVDDHTAFPKQYTMQGIMEENGHQFVDILKMDIEGSEFTTLMELIHSFEGRPLPFGQLQLEIHVGMNTDIPMHTVGDFEKWWKILEDAGLRPFWTETNLLHVNFLRASPTVQEWSFLNIRGHHALVDDSLLEYP